jgi:hypothetical protein
MSYELVAKGVMEGEGLFPRGAIRIGDLLRDSSTGRVFMVESDDFVHEFYGGNIWADDLWRWKGDFRVAPDSAWTDEEFEIVCDTFDW